MKQDFSKVLIDGDVIAHRVAARVQNRVELPELRDQIEAMVMDWARCADEDADIIVCLSDDESFRYWVWPKYKANRRDKEDPPMLEAAFDILKYDYYTWAVPGLEGDDCLGILQTSYPDTVLVSIDKDMLQVPGWHFNPDKDTVPWEQDVSTGQWHLHSQWLMGDSSDNLPGIPRVGAKTAVKILDGAYDPAEMRGRVLDAYAEKELSDTYCRQMERCVRILTRKDYLD